MPPSENSVAAFCVDCKNGSVCQSWLTWSVISTGAQWCIVCIRETEHSLSLTYMIVYVYWNDRKEIYEWRTCFANVLGGFWADCQWFCTCELVPDQNVSTEITLNGRGSISSWCSVICGCYRYNRYVLEIACRCRVACNLRRQEKTRIQGLTTSHWR